MNTVKPYRFHYLNLPNFNHALIEHGGNWLAVCRGSCPSDEYISFSALDDHYKPIWTQRQRTQLERVHDVRFLRSHDDFDQLNIIGACGNGDFKSRQWTAQIEINERWQAAAIYGINKLPVLSANGSEKNWTPFQGGYLYSPKSLEFLDWKCDKMHLKSETTTHLMPFELRGGTNFVEFMGGWLAVCHSMEIIKGKRYYEAWAMLLQFHEPYSLRAMVRLDYSSIIEAIGPVTLPDFLGQVVFPMSLHKHSRHLSVCTGIQDKCSVVAEFSEQSIFQALS